MRGFVLEARRLDIKGEATGQWDVVVFSTQSDDCLDYARRNLTDPDIEVRVLPALAVPESKVSNRYEIGRAH